MSNQQSIALAALVLALTAAPAAAAEAQTAQPDPPTQTDVQSVLKSADVYRLAQQSAQVETQVLVSKGGALQKERRYTVFTRENRQSVVVMRSPAEKGQKVLMLANDYWLVMPSSQRPIRITPLQKLLGDAATGDIATMTWAGDYDGRIVGEEPCSASDADTCIRLSLDAQRKGLSYSRIELWLKRRTHAPVRAELYVASDKLAKRASFKLGPVDGRVQVTEMILTDELQPGRETVIRYLARTAKRAPDEWYNPMFLTRAEIGT